MTKFDDIQLLKLAAQTINLKYTEVLVDGSLYAPDQFHELDSCCWNPLRYSADAFRLAVRLQLHIDINEFDTTVFVHRDFGLDERGEPKLCRMIVVENKGHPMEAARRAIVQAAADIIIHGAK